MVCITIWELVSRRFKTRSSVTENEGWGLVSVVPKGGGGGDTCRSLSRSKRNHQGHSDSHRTKQIHLGTSCSLRLQISSPGDSITLLNCSSSILISYPPPMAEENQHIQAPNGHRITPDCVSKKPKFCRYFSV